jgi:hypothetical protein
VYQPALSTAWQQHLEVQQDNCSNRSKAQPAAACQSVRVQVWRLSIQAALLVVGSTYLLCLLLGCQAL